MNTNDTNTRFVSDTYFRYTKALWIYVPPCFLTIGTISSILSIVVLVRKPMRGSTTMFYLTVLSFGDILVLNTGLLRHWIQITFDVNIRDFSDFSCKFHVFMTYFTLDFTTWILVAVTFDRCLSVCMPLKSKIYCTVRQSRFVVVIIAFLTLLLNGHLLFTVGTIDGVCQELDSFVSLYWPYIDFASFCFLPFITMVICNIFIIRALTKAMKMFHSVQKGDKNKCSFEISARTRQSRKSNVTTMLLSVNAAFFFCTFPVSVFFICDPFFRKQYPDLMELLEAISNLLMYLNNSIHFFLYCITGTKFRNELIRMFTRKKRIDGGSVSYTIDTSVPN